MQAMRLPELFGFILDSGQLPFNVRFGGFEDREYPFRSRDARPYHRSFSIQGGTAVVIGGPPTSTTTFICAWAFSTVSSRHRNAS